MPAQVGCRCWTLNTGLVWVTAQSNCASLPHPPGTSLSGRVSLVPAPHCVYLIPSLHWKDQFSCRCKCPSTDFRDLESSSPEQLLLPDPVDLPASPSIAVAQAMASESSYSLGCGTGSWFPWSGVEKLCWRGRALSLSSCGWAGWAAAANEDLLACCPGLLGQGQSPPLAGSYVYSLFRIPLTTQGSSDPVILFSVIPPKTCVTLSEVLGVGGVV